MRFMKTVTAALVASIATLALRREMHLAVTGDV